MAAPEAGAAHSALLYLMLAVADATGEQLPQLFGDGNDSCVMPDVDICRSDPTCSSSLVMAALQYKRIHGYVIVVVCTLGILANFANIVVLTRKKMRSAVNCLLAALAGAELLLMCVYLPAGVVYYLGAPFPQLTYFRFERSELYFALFHVKLSMVCHAIAVWETIAVATFRYVYLRFPAVGARLCTQRNAQVATAAIIVTCALLSVPNWISDGVVEARVGYDSGGGGAIVQNLTAYPHCLSPGGARSVADRAAAGGLWTIDLSEWARERPAVVRANYWLQSLVVRLLPTALLALLTVLLVGVLRSAEQRRRRLMHARGRDENRRAAERSRTTGMLLVAVLLVLCVEVPHGIYIMVMLADASHESDYSLVAEFIDIAALLAQSLNFFLYTAMSAQFRHTFLSLFCRCYFRLRYGQAAATDAEWMTALGRRSIELPYGCSGIGGGGGGPFVHGPFSDRGTSHSDHSSVALRGAAARTDSASTAVAVSTGPPAMAAITDADEEQESPLLAATRASNGEYRAYRQKPD